jgi:transcription initiation factor TFIIIB Brf1 subunit/transcription initiation factor TFIIB
MNIEDALEFAFKIQKTAKDVYIPQHVIAKMIDYGCMDDECPHTDVIEENGMNTCIECGVELGKRHNFEKEWRYYGDQDNSSKSDPSRCHHRKVVERSIYKDVEHMKFPPNIVGHANRFFDMVTGGEIYRGNSRKAIIFACISQAFKNDKNPKSLEYLQDKFNLKRKVISKGMNHFGVNVHKDEKVTYKCISPDDLIPEILSKLNSEKKHIDSVMTLYKFIKNKSSLLNRSKPQSIGSGLVWFYCVQTNKTTTIKELSALVSLSEATIEKIAKEIDSLVGTNLFEKKKRGRTLKKK